MADADDVGRLALTMPHVTEIDSDGFEFRVAGKGLVWSHPERRPGKPRLIRTDIAVLYVGDVAEKRGCSSATAGQGNWLIRPRVRSSTTWKATSDTP
jgi:hypothetical protein